MVVVSLFAYLDQKRKEKMLSNGVPLQRVPHNAWGICAGHTVAGADRFTVDYAGLLTQIPRALNARRDLRGRWRATEAGAFQGYHAQLDDAPSSCKPFRRNWMECSWSGRV